MPKRINDGTRLESRRRPIFIRRRKTQRRANQPDHQNSRPRDQPEQESLPQGIRTALRGSLTGNRRRSHCAHSDIVTCEAATPVRRR